MKYVLLYSSSLEAGNFGRGILRLPLCLAPVQVVFVVSLGSGLFSCTSLIR